MLQTNAQVHAAGRGRRGTKRRRKAPKARKARKTKRAKRSGKPRPGTKAWMAYIRTKRKK